MRSLYQLNIRNQIWLEYARLEQRLWMFYLVPIIGLLLQQRHA